MARNWSSPLLEFPNKWLKKENADIWEYGSYKSCYLCVRKTDEGKYLPTINGSPNIRIDGWTFSNNTPMLFDSLEEAQQHCFTYMDTIRAGEKAQSKTNEQYLKNFLQAYVNNRTND